MPESGHMHSAGQYIHCTHLDHSSEIYTVLVSTVRTNHVLPSRKSLSESGHMYSAGQYIQCTCLNHSSKIYTVLVSTVRPNHVLPSRAICIVLANIYSVPVNHSSEIYTVFVSTVRLNKHHDTFTRSGEIYDVKVKKSMFL